jgi:hypothetical protein
MGGSGLGDLVVGLGLDGVDEIRESSEGPRAPAFSEFHLAAGLLELRLIPRLAGLRKDFLLLFLDVMLQRFPQGCRGGASLILIP